MGDADGTLNIRCGVCDNVGFDDGGDGFFYCRECHTQAEDIMDTGVADEDFVAPTGTALYTPANRRQTVKEEPLSQAVYQSQSVPCHSQLWQTLNTEERHEEYKDTPKNSVKKEESYYTGSDDFVDDIGPTGPTDFATGFGGGSRNPSFEDYYNEVRMKYIMGIQLMIQLQCEALVERFDANPLICGLTGTIWFRYLAISKVFEDGWADAVVEESEMAKTDDIPDKVKLRAKYREEPHNLYGDRAITIWYRSLRKCIPLDTSLSVCFLACHVARDKILPTDIVKWSLEGKLPYLAAFLDIEKRIGGPSKSCPLSSSFMFRPLQVISFQKLERMAASIALTIGLDLPPVNFHPIACRFLDELSLPVENIIQHACRIYEWSMPSELWLSANEFRLPTRVCVMSILIVAIRILYNLNGFGRWEAALSKDKPLEHEDTSNQSFSLESIPSPFISLDGSNTQPKSTTPSASICEAAAGELLCMLEEKYKEIDTSYEYAKDLPAYLNYCKDVAFAGLEPSFDCAEEEKLIDQLWNYYLDTKDAMPDEDHSESNETDSKRSRDGDVTVDCLLKKVRKLKVKPGHDEKRAEDTFKEQAIRRLQLNMEENRFFYIPPRTNIKRLDYLHYSRKRDEGALAYVAHADYYILLRSCAKVAQVDIRIMHMGVMCFERRLSWLEKKIDHCLKSKAPYKTNIFSTQMEPEDAMPMDEDNDYDTECI